MTDTIAIIVVAITFGFVVGWFGYGLSPQGRRRHLEIERLKLQITNLEQEIQRLKKTHKKVDK